MAATAALWSSPSRMTKSCSPTETASTVNFTLAGNLRAGLFPIFEISVIFRHFSVRLRGAPCGPTTRRRRTQSHVRPSPLERSVSTPTMIGKRRRRATHHPLHHLPEIPPPNSCLSYVSPKVYPEYLEITTVMYRNRCQCHAHHKILSVLSQRSVP